MINEMKRVSAKISEGSIELIYASGAGHENAPVSLCLRMPIETDPLASLAFHCLQALHLMRDALTPEMQELKRMIDRNDETIRFQDVIRP